MSDFDDEYTESLESDFRKLEGALLEDTVRLLAPSEPLRLSPEHVQALDAVSAPVLGFPMTFLGGAVNFMHNGLTVNGVPSQAMDLLQPSPHSLD